MTIPEDISVKAQQISSEIWSAMSDKRSTEIIAAALLAEREAATLKERERCLAECDEFLGNMRVVKH